MNRKSLPLVLALMVALTSVAFAQYDFPCIVLVTSPQDGEVWQAGQTYSVTWDLSGWECPYIMQFHSVELVGLSPTGAEMILDTLTGISTQSPMQYTPSSSVAGYASYVIRFWIEFEWGRMMPYMAGQSPTFMISDDTAPPLAVEPSSLSFILSEGSGTASRTVYVTSNKGSIRWTTAVSHSWLSASPPSGTSVEGGGSVPVAVSVAAAGLPPGKYPATLVFTGSGQSGEAIVKVTLTIVAGGGDASLEVSPNRVIFTHRVGANIQPQEVLLSNTGSERTPWMAEVGADWLKVSPMEGTLSGGATTPVAFSIQTQFALPGSHRTYVHFWGSNGKDLAVLVELNLTEAAGTGPWPPSGQPRLTLPAAANIGGGYGSFWSTDAAIIPTHRLARAAHARHKAEALRSLPAGSALLSGDRIDALIAGWEEESRASAPRGTTQFIWGALGTPKTPRAAEAVITTTPLTDDGPTLFLDILGRYFALTGTSGFLQAAGNDADEALLVSRTYTIQGTARDESTTETYGQSVQAPTNQEVIGPEGGTAYVPGLRYEPAAGSSKGWRSNLFVTEIGGVATSVTVQLHDMDGVPVGTAQTKTLEPFTQWAIPSVGPALGTTLPWTYATVTSAGGGSIVALGSVVDNNSNDPTTINGYVAKSIDGAWTLFLPAAVRVPGAYGTNWRSDLTLLNASASTASFTLQFVPMAGTGAGVLEVPLTLAPYAMEIHPDIVASLFQQETAAGSLRLVGVDTGTLLAFNRIYNLADNGRTYGQGTGAYRPSDAVGRNDGTLYAVGLERSPQYRTNVGVVETAGASATVLFTVVAPTGESRGYMAKIAPGQWFQADDLIRDKVGFAEDFANAWVMIDVVEGEGRVIGYGSIADNVSGDATYLKLERR